MEIWLIVALAAVAGLLVFWPRRSVDKIAGRNGGGRLPVGANANQYVRPPYRAVSIKCGGVACLEAQAVSNVRYLVDDAPVLPLSACDAGKCTCTYTHHLDRRSSSLVRRRSKQATAEESAMMGIGERRQAANLGRRMNDKR